MDKPFITVTGVDERTDLAMLSELEGVEVGILYSATPDGRNRYPRREWILSAVRSLPRTAVHICGRTARNELIDGWLDEFICETGRIQVNGHLDIMDLYRICTAFKDHTIITQYKKGNDHLQPFSRIPNHAILVDASGGRGVSPERWMRPLTKKSVGYAGGLGPDNLSEELKRIQCADVRFQWVDMESSLRINDWFSVDRAKTAVWEFYRFINN